MILKHAGPKSDTFCRMVLWTQLALGFTRFSQAQNTMRLSRYQILQRRKIPESLIVAFIAPERVLSAPRLWLIMMSHVLRRMPLLSILTSPFDGQAGELRLG